MSSAAGAILADADLAVAVDGDPVRDADSDTYSCQLKRHDVNSETYYVTFSRDKVGVSSYEDDSILTVVETWSFTTGLASSKDQKTTSPDAFSPFRT